LHVAIAHYESDVAKLLVEVGADLMAKDQAGLIPGQGVAEHSVEMAAGIRWARIVQLHDEKATAELDALLDAAESAASQQSAFSPVAMLRRAISNQRIDLVDYFLSLGLDLSGTEGNYLLSVAAWYPPEYGQRLLDAGVDIHAKNSLGRTSLFAVVREHNHELARLLLERGADVNVRDAAGTSVLDAAFERRFHHSSDRKTLDVLIDAGHPPTVLYAAAVGDLAMLSRLTNNDLAALDRPYTPNGVRPLHAAVYGEQIPSIRWLIDRGVDRNPIGDAIPADKVDTPLMIALGYNMKNVAIELIERGVDLNCVSRSGYYPIPAVIEWGREPEILEALLKHGAPPSQSYRGAKAEDLATASTSKNRERYLALLREFGGSK
jgi:ankyrin repeat protein